MWLLCLLLLSLSCVQAWTGRPGLCPSLGLIVTVLLVVFIPLVRTTHDAVVTCSRCCCSLRQCKASETNLMRACVCWAWCADQPAEDCRQGPGCGPCSPCTMHPLMQPSVCSAPEALGSDCQLFSKSPLAGKASLSCSAALSPRLCNPVGLMFRSLTNWTHHQPHVTVTGWLAWRLIALLAGLAVRAEE